MKCAKFQGEYFKENKCFKKLFVYTSYSLCLNKILLHKQKPRQNEPLLTCYGNIFTRMDSYNIGEINHGSKSSKQVLNT